MAWPSRNGVKRSGSRQPMPRPISRSAPSWPPLRRQNRVGLEAVLAQQTIPASSDFSHGPPMAGDADMRLALDDATLADLQCQPDNAATAVIAGHRVIL